MPDPIALAILTQYGFEGEEFKAPIAQPTALAAALRAAVESPTGPYQQQRMGAEHGAHGRSGTGGGGAAAAAAAAASSGGAGGGGVHSNSYNHAYSSRSNGVRGEGARAAGEASQGASGEVDGEDTEPAKRGVKHARDEDEPNNNNGGGGGGGE